MVGLVPRTVVHFGKDDPRTRVGGVATFARNLEVIFERVVFMTPSSHDFDWAARERVPIVCDNHWVSRVPRELPVIGFQHGSAFEKFLLTRSPTDLVLAARQRRAARRANTLWVACAHWIADAFRARHGNGAEFVVYHHTDLERFDGAREECEPRLVLHDARTPHKGSRLLAVIAEALPDWRFESLNCAPEAVPRRLRRAAAFIHLSRYEGNSIVCNEAMAQNLPCLFTRVGLFRDPNAPKDVVVLSPERAFGDREWLVGEVRQFLGGLSERTYAPRAWVEQHASIPATRAAWQRVLAAFDRMPWPGAVDVGRPL